jgi:LemA protein
VNKKEETNMVMHLIPILVIVAIFFVFLIFIVAVYNGLVRLRNDVRNSWAQIDVELQRRFDLIPNLVETVKGYTNHEDSVLTKVTELRSAWGSAETIADKASLNAELSNALKSISVVVEQYPDLKANSNFLSLQNELANTESKISMSRATYNNIVAIYNTKLEIFPNNIIGKIFGFTPENFFKVENEEVKQNVKISF